MDIFFYVSVKAKCNHTDFISAFVPLNILIQFIIKVM